MSEHAENISLFILASNESTPFFITHYTKWVVELPSFPSFQWDFFIIDSPKGEDLILRYNLLYHFNPIVDWKNGLIPYSSSNKDSSGISSSASNSLATAVNNIALVGSLKTPSLPYSIPFPSIIPSQSLILSRDEVFKKIKDVEEDAISSLHIFQGEMDLPPLSFNSLLDSKWDEKKELEEIETVLKLAPLAYHQYLDVFSKVKTETHPSHSACDNQIKLEGLLPPIGVINSLSKS
ncbi:hypothetical protein O181_091344 [Austropuccinia psidii MF-1]|uniref:Uncharacterized protein n=1 Tax=Austropuccinia psidii MF-1 TaxID=1389203 RepID=A0A9Q3P7U3_9BASI|nr:hypothetical protein [Austropuccinia psidii MF-1]